MSTPPHPLPATVSRVPAGVLVYSMVAFLGGRGACLNDSVMLESVPVAGPASSLSGFSSFSRRGTRPICFSRFVKGRLVHMLTRPSFGKQTS